MLQDLMRAVRQFQESEPGERFEDHHRRVHDGGGSRLHGLLHWIGALIALAIGVVLVFIPGPAILFFLIAAALIAPQALWLARAMDRGEVRLRRLGRAGMRWWERRPLVHRIAVAAAALLVAISAAAAMAALVFL